MGRALGLVLDAGSGQFIPSGNSPVEGSEMDFLIAFSYISQRYGTPSFAVLLYSILGPIGAHARELPPPGGVDRDTPRGRIGGLLGVAIDMFETTKDQIL